MSKIEYITDSVNVSSLFLPERGLQGEEIPSFILWNGDEMESINISCDAPLSFKEVFNAGIWNIEGRKVTVENIELNGYLGLVFNSEKIDETDKEVIVNYVLNTNNGDIIKFQRKLILFKPKLVIGKPPTKVKINPERVYTGNKIKIKNVGTGTMLLKICTTDDSSIKTITPPNEKEFEDRFEADFFKQMRKLQTEFSHHSELINELFEWGGKSVMEITRDERIRWANYLTRFRSALVNDDDFKERFLNAYLTVILNNIEVINSMNRFVRILESLVASDIRIINPFDVFVLEEGESELIIKLSQTDRMYDEYDDIILDTIQVKSEKAGSIPIYKLFDWRN